MQENPWTSRKEIYRHGRVSKYGEKRNGGHLKGKIKDRKLILLLSIVSNTLFGSRGCAHLKHNAITM